LIPKTSERSYAGGHVIYRGFYPFHKSSTGIATDTEERGVLEAKENELEGSRPVYRSWVEIRQDVSRRDRICWVHLPHWG
jgi:hypothetical protein